MGYSMNVHTGHATTHSGHAPTHRDMHRCIFQRQPATPQGVLRIKRVKSVAGK